ncbi:MAG: class IV adenylate cyclase [Planctomycetota bacterium]
MQFEIEQKFRVPVDFDRLRSRIVRCGATHVATSAQSDCYYRHPVRDFAATDEAFRLRRVGVRNVLAYKGPKFDRHTKSRPEVEAPLADGDAAAASIDEIMRLLGFEPAAIVRKLRETYRLEQSGVSIEVVLDDVEELGRFVEIEALVASNEDRDAAVAAAKQALAQLAATLGLQQSERRSYLELLLEKEC